MHGRSEAIEQHSTKRPGHREPARIEATDVSWRAAKVCQKSEAGKRGSWVW